MVEHQVEHGAGKVLTHAEGPAIGEGCLRLKQLDKLEALVVGEWSDVAVEELGSHQVLAQLAAGSEALVGRLVPGMEVVQGREAVNQELWLLELFPPHQDVLGLVEVGHQDPWHAEGVDEDLHHRRVQLGTLVAQPGAELAVGCEVAVESRHVSP